MSTPWTVTSQMIDKLPQFRYTRGKYQGGRENLETKDGLAPMLSCRRPHLENCHVKPIHITIKVEIKGHSHFYALNCPCARNKKVGSKVIGKRRCQELTSVRATLVEAPSIPREP
ncbi:hypothetical protein EVAR_97903_1 [Eumeta japonica]|uniref:Uncharacterized protein n=1 Tax=Eumeta variegata TaxID=151549 RepID=A0A4C1WHL9_EUMVA|nr:hypothetical protein EVAR_97903_1 [Eumeta japonica]